VKRHSKAEGAEEPEGAEEAGEQVRIITSDFRLHPLAFNSCTPA
jgi:hypothetical protein